MIELSPVERRILSNQYKNLSILDPKEATYCHWQEFIDILEGGWEGHYGRVLAGVFENRLSSDACQLVADVLTMHSCLMDVHGKSNADVSEFAQVGFDGNNESDHLALARANFERHPTDFPGITGVYDNHRPNLNRYRAMVAAW